MSASNDLLPSVAGQPNVRLHTDYALDAWHRHPLATASLSELDEADKEQFAIRAMLTIQHAVRRAVATVQTTYPGIQHSESQPHCEFTMIRREWKDQEIFIVNKTEDIDRATTLRVKFWLSKMGEPSTGSPVSIACCTIRPSGQDEADHILTTLTQQLRGSENGDQVSRPLWLAVQGLTMSPDGDWSLDNDTFIDETEEAPPHLRNAVEGLFAQVKHSESLGSTLQPRSRRYFASLLSKLGKAYETEMQAT